MSRKRSKRSRSSRSRSSRRSRGGARKKTTLLWLAAGGGLLWLASQNAQAQAAVTVSPTGVPAVSPTGVTGGIWSSIAGAFSDVASGVKNALGPFGALFAPVPRVPAPKSGSGSGGGASVAAATYAMVDGQPNYELCSSYPKTCGMSLTAAQASNPTCLNYGGSACT